MPDVITDDGVKLYYEKAGEGIAIVFVHEFAGDYRSYEPRYVIFPGAFDALPTMRAAIRPPKCRRGREILAGARRDDIRDVSTDSGSTRRTSSASRWAGSRRCISGSATAIARARW